MQSSLPAEPIDRNIKAADIADSAEIAKIVAIRVGALLAFGGWSAQRIVEKTNPEGWQAARIQAKPKG